MSLSEGVFSERPGALGWFTGRTDRASAASAASTGYKTHGLHGHSEAITWKYSLDPCISLYSHSCMQALLTSRDRVKAAMWNSKREVPLPPCLALSPDQPKWLVDT